MEVFFLIDFLLLKIICFQIAKVFHYVSKKNEGLKIKHNNNNELESFRIACLYNLCDLFVCNDELD